MVLLVVIRWSGVGRVVYAACERLEYRWRLRVIERIRHVVGCRIAYAERCKPESLLGIAQDAAELVLVVRNVPMFGVRRDHDQRHTKTETVGIDLRRSHVIVPTAPIIPRDEDRGAVPTRALSDGIDHRADPRWPGVAGRVPGVVGVRPGGNDEGDLRHIAGREIGLRFETSPGI